MPAINTRRTAGVGLIRSSFQTPSPLFLFDFGIETTSSSHSAGTPAASLMSLSLSAASSGESEIRLSTFFASPSRPCITSHRGDSGIARTPTARKMLGIAPIPSMNRQLRCTGSFEKAKFET
uniref:Uncharacterized protein n=1 Tax=Opuntia streptacantha TaxID=393608 RepID=A0A7C8ZQU0_OPUST